MDPTVVAVPGYFATMELERRYLARRAERDGPSPADYERSDTITSLAMGVGSLAAPMVIPRLLGPITPGVGRYGKVIVGVGAVAVAITTAADLIARSTDDATGGDEFDGNSDPATPGHDPSSPTEQRPGQRASIGSSRPKRWRQRVRTGIARRPGLRNGARKVAAVGGVTSVAALGVAFTTAWAHLTAPQRLWDKRLLPDLGTGPGAFAFAMVGWDLIYYANHRLMHECRALWAIHVVHHSSERYNLSTALRQPVADAFGAFVPSGLLCLLGVRPSLVVQARGWNLLYQYWVHTDAIRTLGPAEAVLNSPSLHRVHHGSNQQYLDRNHAGILIIWDRMFGTHELEDEPVIYGLTKNIETFNPLRVATHEHRAILTDVARASSWDQRMGHVLREPGWAPAATSDRTPSQVA